MSMLNEVRPAETVKRDRSFKGRLKELLPWKGDDVKEIIRKLVYITAVAVLIYSFYGVLEYKFGSNDMHESNDYLSNLYNKGDDEQDDNPVQPVATDTPDNTDNPDVSASVSSDDTAQTQPDLPINPEDLKYPAGIISKFKPLYDINPEVIGWLTIDGITDAKGGNYIDYPVLQCGDNDYYLSHDFYGREKNYGALFADYHVKITRESGPKNTIIYGHNMGAGTFFSHLHDYKKRVSFVSEHRLVTYSTLWEKNDYIIVGCFLTGIREDQDNIPIFRYHIAFDFEDNTDFIEWYANVMYRSYYTSDIPCSIDDEYLTLSTCSNEIYDSRFVVIARKLRDGEDASQYNYYSNPDARKPAAFYEAYGMKVPNDKGPDYDYYKDILSQMEGNEN